MLEGFDDAEDESGHDEKAKIIEPDADKVHRNMLAPMPAKDAAVKKKSFSKILELKTEEHLRQVTSNGETPKFIASGRGYGGVYDFHRADHGELRDSAKSSKEDEIAQAYHTINTNLG